MNLCPVCGSKRFWTLPVKDKIVCRCPRCHFESIRKERFWVSADD